MLIDNVTDFVVRCSSCHRSTHAYMEPELAAAHWNSGDDLMPQPLQIFWDDPAAALQGEVVAIHLAEDGFASITQQSAEFYSAVIEYTDKVIAIDSADGAIDIDSLGAYNPQLYCRTLRSADAPIRFHRVIPDGHGAVTQLEYRWGESCLFISAAEESLVIARDSVTYEQESPSTDGDTPLKIL